jgi:uncharacterized protein (DUF1810 family)
MRASVWAAKSSCKAGIPPEATSARLAQCYDGVSLLTSGAAAPHGGYSRIGCHPRAPSQADPPTGRKTDMTDPYNLQRFVDAQNPLFGHIRAELRAGRKRNHWMWFVFPQIRGLGTSPMASRYAIASRAEAEAYLKHPVLGPRLRECTRLVNETEGRAIEEIFGYPDDLKFRSSMTLFAHATADNKVFIEALEKYFPAGFDPLTLEPL